MKIFSIIFSVVFLTCACQETAEAPDARDLLKSQPFSKIRLESPYQGSPECRAFQYLFWDTQTLKDTKVAWRCDTPTNLCRPFLVGDVIQMKGIPYRLECEGAGPWPFEILEVFL